MSRLEKHAVTSLRNAARSRYRHVKFLAPLSLQVALIENHLMGGDCLNVGCVPSKALISAARVANTVRHPEAYGVEVSGYVTVNFGKVRNQQ